MKLTLSALTICSILGLTGCSSSGGGTESPNNRELYQPAQTQNAGKTATAQNAGGTTSSTSTTTSTTPNTSTTATTPSMSTTTTTTTTTTPNTSTTTTTPSTPATPTTPNMVPGGHVLVTNNTAASDKVVYQLSNGYADNKLTVEGREIDLGLPVTHSVDEFDYINLSPAELIGIGQGFKNVRFGYYIDYTQATTRGLIPAYQFVIGNMTADSDVPVIGTARYIGRSLIKPIGNGEDAGWFQGYSQFDVDFANKRIEGYVLSSPGEIPLAGSISGSSFSGTHNGNTMQGNFYGSQAAELGGTFSAPITFKGVAANATGAFAAAK